MPIEVSACLVPKNKNSWYLLEDKYLKGGFRVCPSSVERDAINTGSLKSGMLVLTQSDKKIWMLSDDLSTWAEFKAQTVDPFYTHLQPTAAALWTIEHDKNCRHFTFSVFSNTDSMLIPDNVTIVDSNTIAISFSMPVSGHCTLAFNLNS